MAESSDYVDGTPRMDAEVNDWECDGDISAVSLPHSPSSPKTSMAIAKEISVSSLQYP